MISASAINAWDDCKRKWAWQKIAGLVAPSGPSAALGTAVHRVIERYLKFREPIDCLTPEGQIALTGAHLWPTAVTVDQVEAPFRVRIGSVTFHGFKDLDLGTKVVDHKTTGNLAYAKTEESIVHDAQACLYAFDRMAKGASSVELEWIYYLTKAPYRKPATPVRRLVTYQDISHTIERVHDTGATLERLLVERPHPLSLPPTIASCDKYRNADGSGGCPFKERCNLSTIDKIEATMTNQISMQEALAKLSGAPAANAGQVNPGAPAAPPAAVRTNAPPGAQLSPDGGYYLDTTTPPGTWVKIVALPPDPPPAPKAEPVGVETPLPETPTPAEPKRGRGRPPGSRNKASAEVPATAAEAGDRDAFEAGLALALEGLDVMGRAFARRFFE